MCDTGQLMRHFAMALVDVKTEITGNVWKIVAKVGDQVARRTFPF